MVSSKAATVEMPLDMEKVGLDDGHRPVDPLSANRDGTVRQVMLRGQQSANFR